MKRYVLLSCVVAILLLCLTFALWVQRYLTTVSMGSGVVLVEIPRGAGVRSIGRQLAEKGLLQDDVRYLLVARFSGLGRKLQAGEFQIPYGLTPLEVLLHLAEGKQYYHPVTIPEGLTVADTAEIFHQGRWVNRQRFIDLAHDPAFIESLGIEQSTLEGYLFPDTYYLERDTVDERFVLRMMVARFHEVAAALQPERQTRFSLHQVVTIASIIEKETGAAHERPLIARVFLNRLDRGMRLQSDPTVIFGIPDFNGNLTRKDLRTLTPYNTYMIKGLPPGPICSPGRESIRSVLEPAVSDALYFVSKNDGTHIFSRTLNDHNRAVRKYQKRIQREKSE